MSPLSIWNQFFSVELARIPPDPVELAIICCTTVYRSISHIGIEVENCVFNNDAVQEIRRRAPVGKKLKLQVKYNPESMHAIWVKDPETGARIEVLNPDPQTRNLSAYQISLGIKLMREVKSDRQFIEFGEALNKMRTTAEVDLRAKTQTKRKNARKALGLNAAPIHAAPPSESKAQMEASTAPMPSKKSRRGTVAGKKSRASTELPATPASPVPRFRVVKHQPGSSED